MKIRFGIISTASIVPRFIRAAENTDGCCVQAIASRTLEKAQEKARLWNVPKAFGSYEELLQSDEIDAVYIATVNTEHYRFAKLALMEGKHVLCEKPFTTEAEQSRELFALARAKGLFIMEMQKVVFLPVIQKIKKLIKAGTFGAIRMADFSSSFEAGYNTWLYDPQLKGGPLFANAIYSTQLMQYLFDCHIAEYTGLRTRSHTVVENQFSASMLMENGILFTNKTSTCVNTMHSCFLYGEKGYIEIPDFWKARSASLHFPGQKPEILEYPCEYELIYEILHAEECIRAGLCESPVMTEDMTISAIEFLNGLNRLWMSERLKI